MIRFSKLCVLFRLKKFLVYANILILIETSALHFQLKKKGGNLYIYWMIIPIHNTQHAYLTYPSHSWLMFHSIYRMDSSRLPCSGHPPREQGLCVQWESSTTNYKSYIKITIEDEEKYWFCLDLQFKDYFYERKVHIPLHLQNLNLEEQQDNLISDTVVRLFLLCAALGMQETPYCGPPPRYMRVGEREVEGSRTRFWACKLLGQGPRPGWIIGQGSVSRGLLVELHPCVNLCRKRWAPPVGRVPGI